MRLKAQRKDSKEQVIIKPVLFPYPVGIQYETLEGYPSDSFFCCPRSDFIFPVQTNAIMFFVHIWYWVNRYAYKEVRYWWPNKVKRYFTKSPENDLPF